MDTKEMHKKPIQKIWLSRDENGQQQMLEAGEDLLFEMSATYHGSHDEFWIVEFKSFELDDGTTEFRETARINPRQVEGWEWA